MTYIVDTQREITFKGFGTMLDANSLFGVVVFDRDRRQLTYNSTVCK